MDKETFLELYLQLCEETGWMIDACGCCSSPWAIEVDSTDLEAHIEHLRNP